MYAPVGGDCAGITANIWNLLGDDCSSEEINSCATVTKVEVGRLRAVTTAGNGALVVQQLAWSALLGSDAGTQQPCVVLCACCKQVPKGVSNVPIKTMVTAARWKAPLRMTGVYHKRYSTE